MTRWLVNRNIRGWGGIQTVFTVGLKPISCDTTGLGTSLAIMDVSEAAQCSGPEYCFDLGPQPFVFTYVCVFVCVQDLRV